MTEATHPGAGGSYVQAAPDSKAVFVAGTDRKQTPEEKVLEDSARKTAEAAALKRATDEAATAKKAADDPAPADKPADAAPSGKSTQGK